MREHTPVYTPVSNSKYRSVSGKGSYSVEDRVYHVIDASDIELKPWEIAKKVYAPHKPTVNQKAAVRYSCRNLLKRGLIIQPYDGAYCNKITHGVRFVPVFVHNVNLRYECSFDLESGKVVEDVGGVRVRVVFGSERALVTGGVSCDAGMSRDACLFAINRWFAIAEERLGICLDEEKITVTKWECNRDFVGVCLEGELSCLTKRDLYGVIERTYQKSPEMVRHEKVYVTNTPIRDFEKWSAEGFVGLANAQDLHDFKGELGRMWGTMKFFNRRLLTLEETSVGIKADVGSVSKTLLELGENQMILSRSVEKLLKVFSDLTGTASSVSDQKELAKSDGGKCDYVM